MKLLTYLFKEESRFDVHDMYKLNITLDRLESLKKSKSVYSENMYEINKLEEMVNTGEMQIPAKYFTPPIPLLFIVQDDINQKHILSICALKKLMYNKDITILKNDNIMYVELVNDKIEIHGIERAMCSTSKSDYLFRRTNEKDACRVYTGIDLKLSSGKVKVYGKAFGYKLEVNPKYSDIVNQINNKGKEYITAVIYENEPQGDFRIEVSDNVVKVMDKLKDEVVKESREVFGEMYRKVKSGIPLETDFIIEPVINSVKLVKNGKTEIVEVKDLENNFYNDINGNPVIMKVNGKFKLLDKYDEENIKVLYKNKTKDYKVVTLLSRDSFIVATSKTTGIKCRVEGTCKIPNNYEEIEIV